MSEAQSPIFGLLLAMYLSGLSVQFWALFKKYTAITLMLSDSQFF